MLRVDITLISALTGEHKLLGRTYIWNTGTGTAARGNYDVRVLRGGHLEQRVGYNMDTKHLARVGAVVDYPRNSYSVWRLVSRALRSAFPEEK